MQERFDKVEPELTRIFKGEVTCWRREEFLKGGKARANLKYNVGFASLKEAEVGQLTNLLTSAFCADGKKLRYYSFVMDVLLAEAIIRISAERRGVTYEEAEWQMANPTVSASAQKKLEKTLNKGKLTNSQREDVERRMGLLPSEGAGSL